jgi:hypothetical protein
MLPSSSSSNGDPVASRVRDIMARHKTWTGTAAELRRLGLGGIGNGNWGSASGWPKNPRALAGRLRRYSRRYVRSELRLPSAGKAGPELER